MEKECTICREVLDIDNFSVDTRRQDGHISECKKCQRIKSFSKRWEKCSRQEIEEEMDIMVRKYAVLEAIFSEK